MTWKIMKSITKATTIEPARWRKSDCVGRLVEPYTDVIDRHGTMIFRKRIFAFRTFANELSQTNFRTLGLKTYPRRFFSKF